MAIQSNQHKNIWNENLLYLREKISTYIQIFMKLTLLSNNRTKNR